MAAIAYRSAASKSGFSFASLIGTVVAWNDRRMTVKSLSRLSATQLDDIGLTVGDISKISQGDLIR